MCVRFAWSTVLAVEACAGSTGAEIRTTSSTHRENSVGMGLSELLCRAWPSVQTDTRVLAEVVWLHAAESS